MKSSSPYTAITDEVSVSVVSQYLPNQSDVDKKQYVFSYTISIENLRNTPVQLLSRRWLITDANGERSEVAGEGVVGQQPTIAPGQTYTYTSGSVFSTPVGTMQGQYQMIAPNQQQFWIDIPVFRLALPNILN